MTSDYFKIRRNKPLNVPRPEQPKLERAGVTDDDPRYAASQAWLNDYHKRKEALSGKTERIPLDPRLADPTGECEEEGGS